MKIARKKGISKKAWLITASIVVLLGIGGGAYAWYHHNHDQPQQPAHTGSTINTNPPTQAEKAAGDQAKKNTITPPAQSTTTPPSKTNGKTNVSVTITAATQSGTIVQIRALVATVVDSTGSCTLTLTNGSSTVTKTAGTQALANSTTCQGFNIDTSELSTGNWQIDLKYESNTLIGEATGTVTVR